MLTCLPKVQRLFPSGGRYQAPNRRTREAFTSVPSDVDLPKLFHYRIGKASGLSGWPIGVLRTAIKDEDVAWAFTRMAQQLGRGELKGAHVFRTARVTALRKKDGTPRPIVTTDILERFATRVVMASAKQQIQAALLPTQTGVGTKGGVEPVLYTLHRWYDLPADAQPFSFITTLDFANAFGSISRTSIFDALRRHAPGMIPLAREKLGTPTTLLMGQGSSASKVEVTQGVLQGDPSSPFLFSAGMRPVLEALQEKLDAQLNGPVLILAYLDDVVILSNDVNTLSRTRRFFNDNFFALEAKLRLNVGKCKQTSIEEVRRDGLEILGGFVGEKERQAEWLEARTESTCAKLDALADLHVQDAFVLLQQSIHAEVRHLPRYSRSDHRSPGYDKYDTKLKSTVRSLRRSNVEKHTDEAIMALPLREGGLGLPTLGLLCDPAHASCAIAYRETAETWLGVQLEAEVDKEALELDRSQPIQRQITHRAAREEYHKVSDSLNAQELVTIQEGGEKIGHLWLRALPHSKATTMNDAAFASSLSIRMLVTEPEATCPSCGQDQHFRHAESCPHTSKLQSYRHDQVKYILYRAFRRVSGATVHLERTTAAAWNEDRTDLTVTGDLSPDGTRLDIDLAILGTATHTFNTKLNTAWSRVDAAAQGFIGYRQAVENCLEAHFHVESTRKVARYAEQVQGLFKAFVISNGGEAQDTAKDLMQHWSKVVPDWRTVLTSIAVSLQDTRARTHFGQQRGR